MANNLHFLFDGTIFYFLNSGILNSCSYMVYLQQLRFASKLKSEQINSLDKKI